MASILYEVVSEFDDQKDSEDLKTHMLLEHFLSE